MLLLGVQGEGKALGRPTFRPGPTRPEHLGRQRTLQLTASQRAAVLVPSAPEPRATPEGAWPRETSPLAVLGVGAVTGLSGPVPVLHHPESSGLRRAPPPSTLREGKGPAPRELWLELSRHR